MNNNNNNNNNNSHFSLSIDFATRPVSSSPLDVAASLAFSSSVPLSPVLVLDPPPLDSVCPARSSESLRQPVVLLHMQPSGLAQPLLQRYGPVLVPVWPQRFRVRPWSAEPLLWISVRKTGKSKGRRKGEGTNVHTVNSLFIRQRVRLSGEIYLMVLMLMNQLQSQKTYLSVLDLGSPSLDALSTPFSSLLVPDTEPVTLWLLVCECSVGVVFAASFRPVADPGAVERTTGS